MGRIVAACTLDARFLRGWLRAVLKGQGEPGVGAMGLVALAERGKGRGGVLEHCTNRTSAVSHDERSREDLAKARDDL